MDFFKKLIEYKDNIIELNKDTSDVFEKHKNEDVEFLNRNRYVAFYANEEDLNIKRLNYFSSFMSSYEKEICIFHMNTENRRKYRIVDLEDFSIIQEKLYYCSVN